EGVVAETGFLDAFVLELEFAKDVRMVNEENRAGIGDFGTSHQLEQPFGGFELFGMVPEFPAWNFLQRDIASAAELEQRVTGDGVEGLDATIEKDWQAPERAGMVLAVFFWLRNHDDVHREDREDQKGD